MYVVTPERRAPAPLVLCRAVFSCCVTVAALVALAAITAGTLREVPEAVALAPEAAFAVGLGWGLPLGLAHGLAQLVAGGAPGRPDTVRNAATAVAIVPVLVLVVASALSLDLLWLAGLAALHGLVARRRARRWVAWTPAHGTR